MYNIIITSHLQGFYVSLPELIHLFTMAGFPPFHATVIASTLIARYWQPRNLWVSLSMESEGDEEAKQWKALQKPTGVDNQEKSAVEKSKVHLPSSRRQKAEKHQEFQEQREATGNKIQTKLLQAGRQADMSQGTWAFRVCFQNKQGLHLHRTSTDLTYYLETIKASQVSLFWWSETNTIWLNPCTKEEFRERIIRALQTAKCEFSTSKLPSSSNHKWRHGDGDHRKMVWPSGTGLGRRSFRLFGTLELYDS